AHERLLRLHLLRLAPERHVLLLNLHHIVSDRWSLEVLVREFTALYAAFAREAPSPLAALPIQYADFAYWQREWLQGGRLASQLAYWQGALADLPGRLELPTDRPRPAVQTFRGATRYFEIEGELLARLKALGQEHGTTLFMTLLAGFAALLGRYSRQD